MPPRPILATIVLLLAAGCAGNVKPTEYSSTSHVEVTGKVTLADGKPLRAGRITFGQVEGSHEATGIVREGEYRLRMDDDRWGAIPGKYRVCVQSTSKATTVDAKYQSEETSGLTAEITASEANTHHFQLN